MDAIKNNPVGFRGALTLWNRFWQRGVPIFLVDAGNIFDGAAEIDAKRCEVNLKAMSAMGYDAVALSPSDIAYDDAYLSRQRAVATFPFLAPDATRNAHTQPFIVEKGWTVHRCLLSQV